MSSALLVGGYPKGHAEPFHPKTLSGARLRHIVADLELDAQYYDVWANARQEEAKHVSSRAAARIKKAHKEGRVIVALGRHVFGALTGCPGLAGIPIIYLPHPACRTIGDLLALRNGLREIKAQV
ncbi:MAG: hypothetical protein JRN62_02530 [Nitrososphaerota archaeon]|nr:hypothetical protein [Nitrososphaerota archaeon]MDG6948878.1 hypothetical protein [Nitrososphaerota archaeon]